MEKAGSEPAQACISRGQLEPADFAGGSIAGFLRALPREVLSALAEQLSQLKDGARVVTLVKFPFDQFGLRRLPPTRH